MTSRYNHAFTIAFEVISDDPDGDDVTPAMLEDAIIKRIDSLNTSRPDKSEWDEAVGAPYDTYEVTT